MSYLNSSYSKKLFSKSIKSSIENRYFLQLNKVYLIMKLHPYNR